MPNAQPVYRDMAFAPSTKKQLPLPALMNNFIADTLVKDSLHTQIFMEDTASKKIAEANAKTASSKKIKNQQK